jgi:hypothetical protein
VQHEDEAASSDGSHVKTASAADAAAARRVAEAKRRGTQPIALDANAQLQRERRLRNGADWDKATRYVAMVTRIRAEGGITGIDIWGSDAYLGYIDATESGAMEQAMLAVTEASPLGVLGPRGISRGRPAG